MVEETKEEII